MTPGDVIAEVRTLIQDSRTPYRYSDAMLLGFVNQTLKRMAMIRPDLFSVIAEVPTVAGLALQSCPSDSIRLVEVFRVKNGNAITETNRETLDRTVPDWQQHPPGNPVNFMRHVRNPNRFFVYPPPTAGIVLITEYAQTPRNYALYEQIEVLPSAYFPALIDGVVFLAESVDNEHVNSGRAKLFQDSFIQSLGVALQSRVVTDTESGGEDPKQVI